MCEKLHHSYMHVYTGIFITLLTEQVEKMN